MMRRGWALTGRSGFKRSPHTRADRHLCLIFFDILHLDGDSLLNLPYSARRAALERAIRPIPGFASLAQRTPVHLHLGREPALAALRLAFQRSSAAHEEGLVLKSSCSPYPSASRTGAHRWVKLKKDYIPELGDCVDLVLLGAGWDADRARDLRVDTSVLTSWYVGVLVNGPQVRARAEAPHFEVLFRVAYGPSRAELEEYNANVRMGRWGTRPFDRDDPMKRVSDEGW
jgi:DNA ligase-4